MVSCGVYDPAIDNHGYGYDYDYETDLGIKVINISSDDDIDRFMIDYITRQTFICFNESQNINGVFDDLVWDDMYIVLTNSMMIGGRDGSMYYSPSLIEILSRVDGNTHTIAYTLRHELIHYYILTMTGKFDRNHINKTFTECVY